MLVDHLVKRAQTGFLERVFRQIMIPQDPCRGPVQSWADDSNEIPERLRIAMLCPLDELELHQPRIRWPPDRGEALRPRQGARSRFKPGDRGHASATRRDPGPAGAGPGSSAIGRRSTRSYRPAGIDQSPGRKTNPSSMLVRWVTSRTVLRYS